MAKLGEIVTFHTVHGDRAAIVVGHGHDGDNDTQLVVFANAADEGKGGEETGLTGNVNFRWSHSDGQAGGFTA